MAQFPYLLQAGFEAGATNFDTAITDTQSKASYPHYTQMEKYGCVPWRGAYCFAIDQSVGTKTTACNQTQAAFNVTDNNYWSVGLALYLKGHVMTNGDRTTLVACMAGATEELVLELYYATAGGLQLLMAETSATAVGTNPKCSISESEWHWIELYGKKDNGGTNDGTANLVVDGIAVGTISSLNQGDFTDLLVGAINGDAGHTAGYILIDDVTASGIDTTAVRVGYRSRAPWSIHVSAPASTTYGEHLFIGPGAVKGGTLLTANAGDTIRLYDTDQAYTSGTYNLVAEANYSSGMPVIVGPLQFNRGCYCVVVAAGANGARGVIDIDPAPPEGYSGAKCYGNSAVAKYYATRRK